MAAYEVNPDMHLVLGHGSGSFGHVPAAKYGTRQGVNDSEQWFGFAEVCSAAARLNATVREILIAEGMPALSLQPSASAECREGEILTMSTGSIKSALSAGLVPIVYGDVAFDADRGGTIISTEEIMSFLVAGLRPAWILLAGKSDGVFDHEHRTIPLITRENFEYVRKVVGGSHGTDVTGGMASKVESMLKLVEDYPNMAVRIFSGTEEGTVKRLLIDPEIDIGTMIRGT